MTLPSLPVRVQGEELLLHPERAVIWPHCRTVIVADTHFGKSGYFGRHGIAVPAGADDADRRRLNNLLLETGARRLVILGDFVHAPLIDRSSEADDLQAWVEQLGKQVDIHVVAGNHDRGVSKSPSQRLQWWEASWVDPPFRFIHDADRIASREPDQLYTLSGHVHPVVRLRGRAKGALRVPVFWQKPTGLILPSFGLFTGGFAVRPASDERVYAAGDGGVVALSLPERKRP